MKSSKKNKQHARDVTVTARTVSTSAAINGVNVISLFPIQPSAAAIGANFASLANFIAMYELVRIDHFHMRATPRVLAAQTMSPWLIGYVPFGGNNPTSITNFENWKTSALKLGYCTAAALTALTLTEANIASIDLGHQDFTLIEGGGPNGQFIATNNLGVQTSWGNVWFASTTNTAAINQLIDVQIEITLTFRDLYDPVALAKHLGERRLLSPSQVTSEESSDELVERVRRALIANGSTVGQ
jgi:hypothetical protein